MMGPDRFPFPTLPSRPSAPGRAGPDKDDSGGGSPVKFRVERDVLADAVAWTARSLPARPPAPVLAGLLLRAEDGLLSISGFDYEVSARSEVAADVEQAGSALVSGKLLAEIARALPNRPVEIGTEGSKVMLVCGTSRFTLQTMPVDDYPALPQMPEASGAISGPTLAAAVAQVAVAAGKDDTLPFLTGVRVEINGDTLRLAATDRYRLAVREILWKPENPDAESVALVPAKTLHDIAKSLTSGEWVTLALSGQDGSVGDGLFGFEAGGRRTTTRLLDGEFIKYNALFPAEYTGAAVIETAQLIEGVKRVALVAERNTPIRLSFSTGQVTLEAGSGDEAQASESMDAIFDEADISLAFNPGYLLEGLVAIDSPYAQLSYTTSTKPAVITGRPAADAEHDPAYRYLIMPIRLSG
jgi:DNA polymerase III subunit beta